MEKFRFFDSVLGDTREYNAGEFADYFKTLINTGLLKGSLNELEVTADGISLTTTIDTGNVFIDGYWYLNDSSLGLSHDPETLGNNRIDRVVIRLDLTTANRFVKAFIKKGTPAGSPTAPNLTRTATVYELSLAQVYIKGGQSFIEQTDITDERGNANLCPFADSNVLLDINAQEIIDELNAIDKKVNAHLVEKAKYQTATGRDAITITTGGNFAYTQGNWIKWVQQLNNTGAVTINVDSKGAKNLRNFDGTALVSGDLESGSPYEAFYSLSSDFFVLRPRGAKLDAIIAAIVSRGGTVASPQKVAEIVNAINAVATWDSDLISSNVRQGISILGINGNLEPRLKASGITTSEMTSYDIGGVHVSRITVSGLSFQPDIILLYSNNAPAVTVYNSGFIVTNKAFLFSQNHLRYFNPASSMGDVTYVVSNGFRLGIDAFGAQITWKAFKW